MASFKPIQILINAKDEASKVFDKLQLKVAAVGSAILGYFGVKAFTNIVSSAAEFEAAMSRVQAATGASAQEMEQLRKAAEDASAGTKYSAIDTAAALENLAKAGLSTAQSIEALPAAMALAQAGDIELGQSAEYVTKAVMGMGLSFSDAARVADVLALGANATNSSVEGLAQALSYAAPVASSLGVSLESTVAIMGKLADAGIDASRSGTALNNIMSQFSDPASKFRQELAAAGITTTNFEEALHQLAAAGPAGQRAILAVGQNAGPALRALLGQGMGALDELTEKLRNAQGSAADTAAVMQDNLHGALDGLRNMWASVVRALGTPVLPAVQQAVQRLTESLRTAVDSGLVSKFGESMAKAFQSSMEWATKFVGSINFEQLTQRLANFADRAGEAFDRVGQYATNAGNVIKTAYGVMSGGVNAVLMSIYGIGSVFAEVASTVMSGVAKLREGLASVTFGGLSESFKQAAEDAKIAAAGFAGVAQEMRDRAAQSLSDMATSAQTARDGFMGLAGGMDESAISTQTATKSWSDYVREAEAATKANAETLTEIEKRIGVMEEASDETMRAAQAQEELRREYQQAINTGNVQRAAEIMGQLRKANEAAGQSAAGNAKQHEDAAARVAAAFERVGIKTKAALEQAAKTALDDYKLIKESGEATAQDVGIAWQRAAQAAIDAAGGVSPHWVQAQADAHGYTVELDEAGKATLRLKDATDKAGGAASGAADDYDRLGRSAKGAADNVSRLNRAMQEQAAVANSRYSSPLGPDKHARPEGGSAYGNTREERLAGQNAVDNTTMFELRDKLQRGLLTQADLPALQAVLAANVENDKIARAMGPGAWSLEGRADWTKWQATMALFQQAVSRMGGGGGYGVGATDTRKRVDMRIKTDRGDYEFDTDERGEKEIQRMIIDELQRGKKRSTRR